MSRNLSPAEAFGWFRAPRMSSIVGPFMAPQKVAPAEVDRVVLMMGPATNTTSAFLTTDSTAPNGKAFNIGVSAGPFVLTQAEHGPLCQSAWYCTSNSGDVTVCELLLRDFPVTGEPDQATLVAAIGELSRLIRELTSEIRKPV